MTVGVGAEDKLREGEGEPQVIAAMFIKATQLGKEAVNASKFFRRSIVFGYLRSTNDINMVVPYRMAMNFERRTCTIYKGLQKMDLGEFIVTVKGYLINPKGLKYPIG